MVDIVSELKDYNCEVDAYDPWVRLEEAQHEYDIIPISQPKASDYHAIMPAVAHAKFKEMGADGIRQFGKPNNVLYGLK